MIAELQRVFDYHRQIRHRIATLLTPLSPEQVNLIPDHFNNNLIWNAGHVVATQELLVYALAGHDMPSGQAFVDRYRKGTRPTEVLGEAEVDAILEKLRTSPDKVQEDAGLLDWSGFKPYTTSFGVTLSSVEEALAFNNVHEAMHYGTMLALSKLI